MGPPAELGDVMWAVARVFANPRVAQLASRRFATKEQVAVTDVAGLQSKILVCLKTGYTGMPSNCGYLNGKNMIDHCI